MLYAVLSYWRAGGQPRFVNLQSDTVFISLLPDGVTVGPGMPERGNGTYAADLVYSDGLCSISLNNVREHVSIERAEVHDKGPCTQSVVTPNKLTLENGDTVHIGVFSFRFIQTSRYMDYLPTPFHSEPGGYAMPPRFAGRFLMGFERMLDPFAMLLGQIDAYFSPNTAPESILPYLVSWFDLALDVPMSPAAQRGMLRHAVKINCWRNTLYGLELHIVACTDITPQILEWYVATDGTPTPLTGVLPGWLKAHAARNAPANAWAGCFSIVLHSDVSGTRLTQLVKLVDAIARLHRPVHSAFEIWVDAGTGAVRHIPQPVEGANDR